MRFITLVGILLTSFTLSQAGAAPIALKRVGTEYRAEDFRRVGEAIGESDVVSLGESIHLTKEMPQVRLGVVRHLHETKGFNLLALEGSLMDAWTAQEKAYTSRQPLHSKAREFSRQALFGLWQTNEMEEVMAYALSTEGTPNPIYLASFDIQPGMARDLGGSAERSTLAFLSALRRADPSVTDEATRQWSAALGPALNCRGTMTDTSSLQAVESWIAGGASKALASRRPEIHVQTLHLVPVMMRRRLEHCRRVSAGANYQEWRDHYNAELAQELLRQGGKLMLWAHHSHVHHNSLGRVVPSMGQHLKRSLGSRLYTVGVFAAGGTAVDSLKADAGGVLGSVFGLASRPVPNDKRFAVETRLQSLSDDDSFIDLRTFPARWAEPSTSRLEVDLQMPTSLSRDFDGAILLHRVTGAQLNFLPAVIAMPIAVAGWVLQNAIGTAILGLASLIAVVALIRRRRRRRSKGVSAAV